MLESHTLTQISILRMRAHKVFLLVFLYQHKPQQQSWKAAQRALHSHPHSDCTGNGSNKVLLLPVTCLSLGDSCLSGVSIQLNSWIKLIIQKTWKILYCDILFSYITNKSNKIVEFYKEHIDESFHVKLDSNSVLLHF